MHKLHGNERLSWYEHPKDFIEHYNYRGCDSKTIS